MDIEIILTSTLAISVIAKAIRSAIEQLISQSNELYKHSLQQHFPLKLHLQLIICDYEMNLKMKICSIKSITIELLMIFHLIPCNITLMYYLSSIFCTKAVFS